MIIIGSTFFGVGLTGTLLAFVNKRTIGMKFEIILFFLFMVLRLVGNAQTDNLRKEILAFRDPDAELIANGRKMIVAKLEEGDKAKVSELVLYLENLHDQDHWVFYTVEKWMLRYWTGEYDRIADEVLNPDTSWMYQPHHPIRPPEDLLAKKVIEQLRQERHQVIKEIENSSISQMDIEFHKLNFDCIVRSRDQGISLDSMNVSADRFLQRFPKSPYEAFVRQNIRYVFKPSKWGFAAEFFSGYGAFKDALAKSFKNNVPIGVAFDVSYKRFILYLRDYIGFSKTRDTLRFKSGVWQKDAQVRVFLPEASIGYVLLDNRFIKLAPFAGMTTASISPTEYDRNQLAEYDGVGLDFTRSYTLGVNLDVKLGKNRGGEGGEFTFVRLRYGYNKPEFAWKYGRYNGDIHYVTIGFGGFSRRTLRDY